MNYLSFLNTLKRNEMVLFTLQDVEVLFPRTKPKTIKNNLTNWLVKGYIRRLKRNLYECVQPDNGQHIPDYYVANRLYQPSYVSLETALSFYNIIPGEAAEVTSVTTKATRTIRNRGCVFTYRTCKKNAFLGYRLMKIEGYKALIADREKALVDFIYYRMLDGQGDFMEERLNLSKVRPNRARSYAKKFNKKTLDAVELLM